MDYWFASRHLQELNNAREADTVMPGVSSLLHACLNHHIFVPALLHAPHTSWLASRSRVPPIYVVQIACPSPCTLPSCLIDAGMWRWRGPACCMQELDLGEWSAKQMGDAVLVENCDVLYSSQVHASAWPPSQQRPPTY